MSDDARADRYLRRPSEVSVEWLSETDGPTTVSIDELDAELEAGSFRGWQLGSVRAAGDLIPRVLQAIGRHVSPDDAPEIELNGSELVWGRGLSDERVLVPNPDMPGVATLAFTSASWLPGGPVEFDQYEGIYEFDGQYWVQSSGDAQADCIYVGRFESPVDGVDAAVAASAFFSFSESGRVVSELDQWRKVR